MIKNHGTKGIYLSEKAVKGALRRGERGSSKHFKVFSWEEPARALTCQIAKDGSQFVHPSADS